MSMRALELFAGACGGWSLGLHRAGIETVAACEIDPWRRAVFAANHPRCRMYDDVRELSADRLIRDLGFLPDVVVGSPPCQEISAANSKGKGITDDHLFWDWARLVFEIRPVWCAAENSPRARTTGIDGIIDALAQAGYPSWACVVGARHAGANHRRERLWLVAADAERIGIREQPGRRAGADGRAAPFAGEHDPDADGRLAGSARRHAHGCVEVGAGAHEDDPDAYGEGEYGRARNGEMGRGLDWHSWNASRERRAEGRPEPIAEGLGLDAFGGLDARDADRARHAIGLREPGDDGAELPPALRAIGLAWPMWNNGLAGLAASCAAAGFSAVDDGSNAILAPGLRNRAIAALGDAVMPQITEAIARAAIAHLTEARAA